MLRRKVVIASQLDAGMHDRIQAALPGLRFISMERGFPAHLPPEATVFFAAPFRDADPALTPKAGWPRRVEWIQLVSAGADGYPKWYFDGPTVTCARGPTAVPVAEFALAAIFAHSKRFPQAWIAQRSQWKPLPMEMLEGTTLGIVGYGAIGQRIAQTAVALGMRVLVNRRSKQSTGLDSVHVVPLEDLFRECDHVVIAAAATAQTRHLVDEKLLAAAKPGLHLVNVARGSLVDQDALLRALQTGRVGSASLDVTDPEPLPDGHALYSHPQVRLSPHVSALDARLRERLATLFIENLERFRCGESLVNVVDQGRGY